MDAARETAQYVAVAARRRLTLRGETFGEIQDEILEPCGARRADGTPISMWRILCALSIVCLAGMPSLGRAEGPPKRVAAIVTAYYHNSHADVIVSRLLQTYTLDGQGESPNLKLVSLCTDQVPENDISRALARRHGFKIYDNVADALTLGTGRLAVDGVLLVAEHGDYPRSKTGQIVYPKLRLFDQVAKAFVKTGQTAPLFIDKHLADNWADAKSIYDTCRRLKVPLMAGSSLPTLWRYPPVDTPRGARLKEILALSYHTLDGYGFHGLEMAQALAERRRGGETGVGGVQCLTGEAVWQAGRRGVFDQRLLEAALARLKRPPRADRTLRQLVREPVLFTVDYRDGLRLNMLTLNGAVAEWAAAWRDEEKRVGATLFWTQEERPLMHFSYLVQGVDRMMQTGRPTWPAERTLLTSGMLDALLISKSRGGARVKTPELNIHYQNAWNWRQPPPPPPGRPLSEQ